jgi:phospholipid/cholesterol/gamma-HCH transport system substrate-binding protein
MTKRVVFGLVFLAVAITGCAWAGGGDDRHVVVARFADVGDLVERATVQVNDVEVGTVTDIELEMRSNDLLARVEMELDDSVRISSTDMGAVIRQSSLLGEQFVELVPSSSGPPYVGDDVVEIPVERTDKRVDVETFLSDLSGLVGSGGLEDLNRFTHAQALILEERGARLGRTLEELERFTGVLSDRSIDVGRAIDSLASAGQTIAANQATLDSFLDSLDEANALLADQGDELGDLFRGLARFGEVNARFLARHERSIDRNFKALRPILDGLASTESELRADIAQLRVFLELFPKAAGGGPGDRGQGDYIQAEAVLCEALENCHSKGEIGDVPGQGAR